MMLGSNQTVKIKEKISSEFSPFGKIKSDEDGA